MSDKLPDMIEISEVDSLQHITELTKAPINIKSIILNKYKLQENIPAKKFHILRFTPVMEKYYKDEIKLYDALRLAFQRICKNYLVKSVYRIIIERLNQ